MPALAKQADDVAVSPVTWNISQFHDAENLFQVTGTYTVATGTNAEQTTGTLTGYLCWGRDQAIMSALKGISSGVEHLGRAAIHSGSLLPGQTLLALDCDSITKSGREHGLLDEVLASLSRLPLTFHVVAARPWPVTGWCNCQFATTWHPRGDATCVSGGPQLWQKSGFTELPHFPSVMAADRCDLEASHDACLESYHLL